MSNIRVKNVPRLGLSDLLRRRKMTLGTFMHEFGITTYEALSLRCKRLGVQPPSLDDYASIHVPVVSNPTEGLIVLRAEQEQSPDEGIEQKQDYEIVASGLINITLQPPSPSAEPAERALEGPQKKQRKKKEGYPTDE